MAFVEFLASRVWLFLVSIGEICQLTLVDVTEGFELTLTNPWNDVAWDISFNSGFVSEVLTWLTDTLEIPLTYTVLDCLLFVFATIFAIAIFVRLFSMTTPD